MPESGRRVFATHHGHVSKIARAPRRYVYDWLTDYREDDGRFSRSKPRFRVLRMAKDRIVRVRYSKPSEGGTLMAVELVRLRPPDAWHLDQIDERDLEAVDYKVTRLGPRTTRVELWITERWMVPEHPSRAEWLEAANRVWDNLVLNLERSYDSGRPARGRPVGSARRARPRR